MSPFGQTRHRSRHDTKAAFDPKRTFCQLVCESCLRGGGTAMSWSRLPARGRSRNLLAYLKGDPCQELSQRGTDPRNHVIFPRDAGSRRTITWHWSELSSAPQYCI